MIKPILSIIFLTATLSACGSDNNAKPVYGDTGLPKNCRAIIATNIQAWRNAQYSAEDVLESIDRNCGINGYSWTEK